VVPRSQPTSRLARTRPVLAVVCLLLVAAFHSAATVAAQTASGREVTDETRRIGQELQCPICEGLSVADSTSQLAVQMRGVIREKVEAGESREAILQYFVERYGENILMAPPRHGFTSLVWIAPWIALLGTLAFLGWKLRRRSQTPEPSPATDPTLTPYYDEVDHTYEVVRDEAIR
jgi:cytochrome c-type biogenesis protein CcmH